jgi:hypothetical protein
MQGCAGTGQVDDVCMPCTASCEPGSALRGVETCTGEKTANSVSCVNCSEEVLSECPFDEYTDESMCDGQTATTDLCDTCKVCSDEQYATTACTRTANRDCAACTAACPLGEFIVQPCDLNADISCNVCIPCATGKYAKGGCDAGTINWICADCTICPESTIESAGCTPSSDAVCTTALGK